MPQSFHITAGLRARLEALGINAAAVLHRAGLPPDLFDQPHAQIGTEAHFALWQAIGAVSRKPGIGLRLGSDTGLERLPPSILTALSAPDFGAAVDLLARYKRLTCPEEIVQDVRNREWRIRFRWLHVSKPTGPEPRALVECCFARVLSIGRQGTGQPLAPARIDLREAQPHLSLIERHFGCPVRVGAKANAIVFPAAYAHIPFITRNAELQAILAPHFELELRQLGDTSNIVELVRGAMRDHLIGRKPELADVARQLHQSPRTLQRRLRAAGASFQQLLDDVRHRMACHYLSDSALELNEIAFHLGFEEGNSFVRAFHAWEGRAPGQWRRALTLTGAGPSAALPRAPLTKLEESLS